MQKDEHVQEIRSCSHGAWMWCFKWTMVQSLAKKPDLPWYATPTQLTRSFLIWYDTCTDHPVWGQCGDRPGCSIFSKHRRPTENGSNVSRKWNRSIVSALHDNRELNDIEKIIKLTGCKCVSDAKWWIMERLKQLQKIPCFSTCLWAKHYLTQTETGKKTNSERERDRDRNKDTERVKALPHEAPSSDSRQRETEEERKVSDSTSINSHLTRFWHDNTATNIKTNRK